MYSYAKDKNFWSKLKREVVHYLKRKGSENDDLNFSENELRQAFFDLAHRYRDILEMRAGQNKTTKEIGKDLAISKQRVSQLEQRAYSFILKSILAARKPTPWEEKPLINDKCHDFRSVDCVLRILPPGLLARLRKNNYKTMHQVCAATPRGLMEINGVGPVAVRKLEVSLIAYRQNNPQYFYN